MKHDFNNAISNLLIDKYPELVENEWDYDKNNQNHIYPDKITCGSNVKAYWKCHKCNGSYRMSIQKKTNNAGCPYCSGHKVLQGFNDLMTTHHELIESEWDWVKNDEQGLKPNELSKGSNRKASWLCEQYKHSYEMSVNHRTAGRQCPYCMNRKVLKGFNDLQSNYPDLINSEWDWTENDKKSLKPDMLTKNSAIKAYWKCNKTKHEHSYEMRIVDKTHGQSCPYCAGRKALAGFNDLETLYPDLAKEWYQPMNGNVTPSMITKGVNMIRIQNPENPYETIKVKPAWKCSKCGYIWRTTVTNRTLSKNSTGCPSCWRHTHKSKQEDEVADFIENYLCKHHSDVKFTILRSISFKEIYKNTNNTDNSPLNKHMRKELDIYIPELNFAVEYDGEYWHNDEMTMRNKNMTNQEIHAIKHALCEQLGITLLIITEHDWVHDTENVKTRIIRNIIIQKELIFYDETKNHNH